MTKREVGSLAYKLAGIYVLIQAMLDLSSLGLLFSSDFEHSLSSTDLNWWTVIGLSTAPVVLLCALGAVLIRYSETFAKLSFPEPAAVASAGVAAGDLQAAALAVVGIAMIASVVPDFG
jgi:hypothetical protein